MTDDPEITDPRDPYRRPDIVTELDRYLVRDETVGFTEMVQRARDEIVGLRGLLEHSDRTVIKAVAVATPAIRAEALEEAALIVDRHPDASRHRDSELMRGCCEVMAADIRKLKDKGDE